MIPPKSSPSLQSFIFPAFGLALLLSLSGCGPSPAELEKVRQEVKDLKTQVAALKEQVNKLEASQQQVLTLLRQLGVVQLPPPPPPPGPPTGEPQAPAPAAPPAPGAPPAAAPAPEASGPQEVSLGQLLKEQGRFLNTRVKVKGRLGMMVLHRKTLSLTSPEGSVEVFFGKLPDIKAAERLGALGLNHPLTVTGTVTAAPKGPGLRLNAESVEF